MVRKIILIGLFIITAILGYSQEREYPVTRHMRTYNGLSIGENGVKIDSIKLSQTLDTLYTYVNGSVTAFKTVFDPSPSLTAYNGLVLSNDTIKWEGPLNEDVSIIGQGYSILLGDATDLGYFNVNADSLGFKAGAKILFEANAKIWTFDGDYWRSSTDTLITFAETRTLIGDGTLITASNGIVKTGTNLTLDGTLNQNTSILGSGYDFQLGQTSSRVNNFRKAGINSYQDMIGVFSWSIDESDELTWDGNQLKINTDTVITFRETRTLIEVNKPDLVLPYNLTYTYDISTVDSRPGIGNFRLDNAVYANVNQIYIDDFDGSGISQVDFITQVDSGSYITITDGTNYINYQLIGYDVGAFYTKYNVTYISNNGIISGILTFNIEVSNNTGGGGGGSAADSTYDVVTGTDSVKTAVLSDLGDDLEIYSSGYIRNNPDGPFSVSTGNDIQLVSTNEIALSSGSEITIEAATSIDLESSSQIQITSTGSGVSLLAATDVLFTSQGSAYRVDDNTFFMNGESSSTANDLKAKGVYAEVLYADSSSISGYNIRFNESEGVHEFLTAKNGVIWQGALEDLFQFYNNTGNTIENFTPLYYSGVNGDSILTCDYATASIGFTVLRYAGMSTGSVPDGTWGFGNRRGKIREANTSLLSQTGTVFLGNDSLPTMTKPAYPSEVLVLGGVIKVGTTDGIFYHDPSFTLRRQIKSKSYTFTSLSIGSGEYWKAGFYYSPVADANLTQASASITYGTADIAYEAHPFAVYGGIGSVTGGGRVALIVTGTSYNDITGVQTPANVDTIINDITNAVVDIYDEAIKYHGEVTYELVIAEGAPSAYSLDFNYGYAKYDDLNDRDFYISAIEAVWIGDGIDATGFDIELYKHSQTGWTYAASGFTPGNGVLADRSTDQAGFLRVANGIPSAWKRSQLDSYINGNGEEGYLIKITTGASGTIQTMDIHVESAIE